MLCNVISDERGKPRVISCAARNVAPEIFLPFPFVSLGRAARYALARLRLTPPLEMTEVNNKNNLRFKAGFPPQKDPICCGQQAHWK